MKHAFSKQKGFTLIEMLVVISIIGILSAVLYASFGEARVTARNRSLQAEIREVQLSLELYKAQNGRYPEVPSSPCGSDTFVGRKADSTNAACVTAYIANLIPDYISELPSHQLSANANCNISYQVANDGSWYKLTAERCHAGATTAAEGVQVGDEFARCLNSCGISCTSIVATEAFYESYAVYSAGGECQ
ncbi:type II secretion system protein [Candidatus Kaiserbacteria bacterium]|nr:type II secretion system protein [Candidatus Kaiserbacteria bacterium]NCT01782.1 type II secretion system protein [Candidatus Parcubacteria bacterium]